jgi:large subunit ribosomal protein L9
MKVILLKDVAKIGRRMEVKEVPSGHALNFLIPRKLAVAATADALRTLDVELKKRSIISDKHDTSFRSALEMLETTPVQLSLPANEQGHLFKGVHAHDIAHALKSYGVEVKESEVLLNSPIKETGEHLVTLRSGDTEGTVKVIITNV